MVVEEQIPVGNENFLFKEFKEYTEGYLLKNYRRKIGITRIDDIRTLVRSCEGESALKGLIDFAFPRNFDIHEDYNKLKEQFLGKKEEIEIEKSLKVVWVKEILESDIPEPSWVVENLIPTESVNILGGDSGSFKTYFALYSGICVAHGKPILNIYNVNQGNVLYIDEENGIITLKKRIKKIKNGLEQKEETQLGVLNFSNIKFDSLKWKEKFKIIMDQVKPILVIVDSLVRTLSGDEDRADSVKRIFDFCKPFISEYKCSFLFLHHTRKVIGARVKEDLRGSSDLAAMCDSVLMMNKNGENYYTLAQVKNRHQENIKPIQLLVIDPDTTTITINYGGEAPTERKKKSDECAEDIMTWIQNNEAETLKTGEIEEITGFKRNTVRDACRILQLKGVLRASGWGLWEINRNGKLNC